jgi:predicted DNA-binding protein
MSKADPAKRKRACDEQVTLRLPRPLLRRLDSMALEAACPRSYAIRQMIRRGLEAEN